MSVHFDDQGWEDYLYWQRVDKRVLKKINELIRDVQRSPFEGVGKPEPLKYDLVGLWSRRIDSEHRLVYEWDADNNCVIVLQCRYHYQK
ncbi:MAG: Txe/YoeB family addiction module toxin [Puniceicoccales bacterium]